MSRDATRSNGVFERVSAIDRVAFDRDPIVTATRPTGSSRSPKTNARRRSTRPGIRETNRGREFHRDESGPNGPGSASADPVGPARACTIDTPVGVVSGSMSGVVDTVRSLLLRVVDLVIFVVTLPLRLVKRLLRAV